VRQLILFEVLLLREADRRALAHGKYVASKARSN